MMVVESIVMLLFMRVVMLKLNAVHADAAFGDAVAVLAMHFAKIRDIQTNPAK